MAHKVGSEASNLIAYWVSTYAYALHGDVNISIINASEVALNQVRKMDELAFVLFMNHFPSVPYSFLFPLFAVFLFPHRCPHHHDLSNKMLNLIVAVGLHKCFKYGRDESSHGLKYKVLSVGLITLGLQSSRQRESNCLAKRSSLVRDNADVWVWLRGWAGLLRVSVHILTCLKNMCVKRKKEGKLFNCACSSVLFLKIFSSSSSSSSSSSFSARTADCGHLEPHAARCASCAGRSPPGLQASAPAPSLLMQPEIKKRKKKKRKEKKKGIRNSCRALGKKKAGKRKEGILSGENYGVKKRKFSSERKTSHVVKCSSNREDPHSIGLLFCAFTFFFFSLIFFLPPFFLSFFLFQPGPSGQQDH